MILDARLSLWFWTRFYRCLFHEVFSVCCMNSHCQVSLHPSLLHGCPHHGLWWPSQFCYMWFVIVGWLLSLCACNAIIFRNSMFWQSLKFIRCPDLRTWIMELCTPVFVWELFVDDFKLFGDFLSRKSRSTSRPNVSMSVSMDLWFCMGNTSVR